MRRLILCACLAILAPACLPEPQLILTPPVFGGVTGGSSPAVGQVSLTWNPAVDYSNTGIIYGIAWSFTQGGEVQGSADSTLTSDGHGVLISGLVSTNTYWFIVQAQDGNGVADTNSPPPEIAVTVQ